MGIKVSTEAYFAGVKTGNKKTGEGQWLALKFKAVEYYKGMTVDAAQMTEPNMTIFPSDDFDATQLEVGKKYVLSLSVSGSKTSSYPNYDLIAHKLIP